jgi:hypothetical protein
MKKRKLLFVFVLMLLLTTTALIIAEGKHNYKPKDGYVPDEKTAIRIAVAVWIPIYGEKQIEGEKPYHAKLDKGIWTIEGSLPEGNFLGGVALAEIAKDDGRILRVSHGQ